MIGIFNTITINGTEVYRPNEFTLTREKVTAAEITTCTGKFIADLIGWKYADMELSFDTLPQDMMNALLQIEGAVDMTFTDEEENSVTEKVLVRSSTAKVTRMTNYEGKVLWRNFALAITFINAHPNQED